MALNPTKKRKHRQSTYVKSKDNRGTIYVVCGVGCEKAGGGKLNHPAMVYSSDRYDGSMSIEINNNKLLATFLNKKGRVKDSFIIIKSHRKVE